ncbi:hypothetical protein [Marivirga lumbricoides]
MKTFKNTLLALLMLTFSCQENLSELETAVKNDFIQNSVAGCNIDINGETGISCKYTSTGLYSISGLGSFNNPQISWSTSGTGILIPFGASNSTVQVTFKPTFNSGELTATVTDGSLTCSETITIDCKGSNGSGGGSTNCGQNDNLNIVENIEPCYPSQHPHGRYTLTGESSSNISWSVQNGTIFSSSGDYVVMKPTSIGGYTLTATITYPGGCKKTYSKNFYAESCL